MIIYLINYFTITIILGLSGKWFPEFISYDNPKTVFITVGMLSLVELCIYLLYMVSSMNLLRGKLSALVIMIILVVASFTSVPLSLFLADKWITGFEINGILTYLILTILIQTFTVNSEN